MSSIFNTFQYWVEYYPASAVGTLTLASAYLFAILGFILLLSGALKRSNTLVRKGERSLILTCFFVFSATLFLAHAFLVNDFSLEYVASHSSSRLPRFYAFTALWGGQSGSLLFWIAILCGYTLVVLLAYRNRNRLYMPWVALTLDGVILFFLTTVIFAANPFKPIGEIVADGRALNPILQHPLMAFHPPALYLGYVGFTVPFAFAIAALFTGHMSKSWLSAVRQWAVIPWFFLTWGMLLGSRWAYVELGWGGYWAWDPVENASLLPWLLATAYLHSIMIQEKKNMLRMWNLTLIISTFVLSILGTFITRSGILSSVHAFAVSAIGDYFIVFLAFVIFYGIALLYIRWPVIKSERRIEHFLSKESSFLFNNLILTGIMFAVLWGTLFPLISDIVTGHRMNVAAPFFNAVNSPLGLALLILTGICPLIAWRKASWKNFRQNFLYPLVFTFITAVIVFVLGLRKPLSLTFATSAFFVMYTILYEFFRGIQARVRMHGESFVKALFKLLWKHPRRYGGYIVHLGVVFIFFGIVGTAFYQQKTEVHLKPGESHSFEGYTFEYKDIFVRNYPHKQDVRARLLLKKDNKLIKELQPGKEIHFQAEQPVSEIALYSTFWSDIYTVLASWKEDRSATFIIYHNPLIMWIWIGGITILIGGVIIFIPRPQPSYQTRLQHILNI